MKQALITISMLGLFCFLHWKIDIEFWSITNLLATFLFFIAGWLFVCAGEKIDA